MQTNRLACLDLSEEREREINENKQNFDRFSSEEKQNSARTHSFRIKKTISAKLINNICFLQKNAKIYRGIDVGD